MLLLKSFSPNLFEWFFVGIGALSLGLSMHWTFNLSVLVMGLDGQSQNSLEAVEVLTAFKASGDQIVNFGGEQWNITTANQNAYCLQNSIFAPIGSWYASFPTIVQQETGEFTSVFIRSTLGIEEMAKAARFITLALYAFSLMGILTVNLKRINAAAFPSQILVGAALLFVFLALQFVYGFYGIRVPVQADKFIVPIGDHYFLTAAKRFLAWNSVMTIISSIFLWALPFMFIFTHKRKTTYLLLLTWALSTPVLLLLSAADQWAC